ncbi:unnamed protein product [Microthlaspi erraticum]|uniref:Uncharacterized protein n=1 Tax=Microthlaspi erraticum TaxID=1685480 RepID=A0A6D2IQK8_9BRAS|nr:unnamed protein product [Microthlaspi erraticum]
MNSQKRERTKLKGEYKEMPTWSLIELELVFTSTGIARMAVNWLTRESLGGLEVFLLGLSGPGLQSWIKVMGPYGLDSRAILKENSPEEPRGRKETDLRRFGVEEIRPSKPAPIDLKLDLDLTAVDFKGDFPSTRNEPGDNFHLVGKLSGSAFYNRQDRSNPTSESYRRFSLLAKNPSFPFNIVKKKTLVLLKA